MTKERASTERHYLVTRKDLPLSCPMPRMRLWDAHPKVYIPIEKTGKGMCYYCGASFELVDEADTKQGFKVNEE